MLCPICKQGKAYIKESRSTTVADAPAVRRRYQCSVCDRKFTTFEVEYEVMRDLSRSYNLLQSFKVSTIRLLENLFSNQTMTDIKELVEYFNDERT